MTRFGVRWLASCMASFACFAGLLLWPGLASALDEPSRYGKTLVKSYEIPAELLDQYNEAVHSQAGVVATLADVKGWTGSEFSATAAGNPYTLVVKMLGAALDADDVVARWQPFWGGAPGVIPGIVESPRAGELLQLVVASEPAKLEDGRLIAPGLRLNAARNIRLERVRVEVWSGVGETSLTDLLLDWWPFLAGAAVWACLLIFLRYERRNATAAGEPAEK